MKRMTGFVWSIVLNIIIHKTNKSFSVDTQPLFLCFCLFFFFEWHFFKENVTFMVTEKKKKISILQPWPLLVQVIYHSRTKSITIFWTGSEDKPEITSWK